MRTTKVWWGRVKELLGGQAEVGLNGWEAVQSAKMLAGDDTNCDERSDHGPVAESGGDDDGA